MFFVQHMCVGQNWKCNIAKLVQTTWKTGPPSKSDYWPHQ